jgi:hypothetical protein
MDIQFLEQNVFRKNEHMEEESKAVETKVVEGSTTKAVEGSTTKAVEVRYVMPNPSTIFSGLSNIILAAIAIYLCWTRNTEQNESLGLKIVYCIIAFYFPLIYIIYYSATRKRV